MCGIFPAAKGAYMSNMNYETERRFLIRFPDRALLASQTDAVVIGIEQTYLLCSTGSLRVRKSVIDGRVIYYRNEKRRVNNTTSEEYEDTIDENEFQRLLGLADPERRTVAKTRYTFPYKGHIIETDVFPFWEDRAITEVELDRIDEALELPPFLSVIKEITGDSRYSNRALAKEIFTEELPADEQ